VLVADVVGSTELFGRLGVDKSDDARRALFSAFFAAIGAGDGALIKTMGDGCLASFGGAADAVTAAIALQRAVGGLREHKIPGLSLRVGVAVGDVTEEDGDVFGPAVVTASRLCSAAGEHQILATDVVRMLAGDRGGHHYEAVGELILKGIADPVSACTIRVDTPARGAALPAALAATPAELVVGRGAELDVLSVAFKAASAGERRAVLVAGEPGVGKTRLVAALARRAHDEGALVLFGRCEEDLAVAYQPFAEALRAGLAGLDPEVVAAHVAAHGGEIRRLVPVIEAAEPIRAEPGLEQARLFDAVTDLLQRAAEDRVVVLVLDDLHWAASSTIVLLRHLLGADPNHRLCVLGTYRDTEVDRAHPLGGLLADIHRVSGVERLALRGLDAQGIEDLLAAVSDDELDDDGRDLAAAIAERTDGNPFFANQVLRHLAERGVLVQEAGRWTVSGPLDDVDLPEGVLDVVGRRLSRLSPAANQALAVAALGGLDFGVRVLCEVPDAGNPDAVVDGLDEAVRARLLVETGPGRFAFTHAIVRDALTRELTMAKRARLHRALGEAILAVYGDAPDVPLAELARHFTEAAVLGDTAAGARWATAAARAAADQADHRGAIAVLERALAVIETVEPVDQATRFAVAAALAEHHHALMETDAGCEGSAVDAARRLGSGARMLRIAIARHDRGFGRTDPLGIELYEEALQLLDPAEIPLRALAVASLAWRRSLHADPGFRADVEAANALLPNIETSAPMVAVGVRRWLVAATLGLPGGAQRLRLCDEALAVSPGAEDPWWAQLATGVDIAGRLQLYRGHSLMVLGRRAEFETNLAQVMDLGETTGNIWILGMAHAGVALLALLDGRFDDVAISANRLRVAAPDEESLRLSYFSLLGVAAIEEGRFAELLPMTEALLAISPDLPAVHAALGRVRLDTGDHLGAAKALDHLISGWTDWAREPTWPSTLAQTAEIVAGLGATEHAELIADELGSYAGEMVVAAAGIFCWGAFDRYRGMLLGLLGRSDEAVATLTTALALEESVESPPLTARTRYWLARALMQRDIPGDRERAAAELNCSIQTAERLGMEGLASSGRKLAALD
jgi:class 3 adenylate cyclase/tetratricopeptide (TPR) repeat protein